MIITEQRWKCDYCGVVSPVIERDEEPRGWVVEREDIPQILSGEFQFCSAGHQDRFRALPDWDKIALLSGPTK